MQPRVLVAFIATCLCLAAGGGAAEVHAEVASALKPVGVTPTAVPGELIVAFERRVSARDRSQALARVGAVAKKRFRHLDAVLASVPAGERSHAIQALRRDGRVRYAEPNFLLRASAHSGTPDDPAFHELWGLENFSQTVNGIPGTADADIDATEAWGVTTGDPGVAVAVIDTGIDYNHPDLAANVWLNPGETCAGCRSDRVDNDGNGYVDDVRGWDFANEDADPFDDHGHGTHVAGTIGASGDNGIGVAGVNWAVRLMPLKFLGADGSGTSADAIRALLYAVDEGAVVSNNSYGGDGFSQAFADAIADADAHGSLFVAAAGNSLSNNDVTPTTRPHLTSRTSSRSAATDPPTGGRGSRTTVGSRSTWARQGTTSTPRFPEAATTTSVGRPWPRRMSRAQPRSRRRPSRPPRTSASKRSSSGRSTQMLLWTGRPQPAGRLNVALRRHRRERHASGLDRVPSDRLRRGARQAGHGDSDRRRAAVTRRHRRSARPETAGDRAHTAR